METLGLEGKMHKAKIKSEKYQNQQKTLVSVCPRLRAGSVGRRLRVALRLSKGPGLPPAELGHGSSSPTQVAPRCGGGSLGGGLWLAGWSVVLTAWQTPMLYPCP